MIRRVLRAHRSQYPDPIAFVAGERVSVGRRDDAYPGWIWTRTPDGNEGWAPETLLTPGDEGEAVARADYVARELDTTADVLVTEQRELHGWLWVRDASGATGWIPAETTEPVDVCAVVRDGYDTCGQRYLAARQRQPPAELEPFFASIPPGSRVVDLGCGAGVPFTQRLAAEHRVIGVDVSRGQLALARRAGIAATFVVADMSELQLKRRSIDAVGIFYALSHVPRTQHREILARTVSWLRSGGRLCLTTAHSSEHDYVESDFFDSSMFWSHFDAAWYAVALDELGLHIEQRGELDHGYAGDDLPVERHPYIVARAGGGEP